MFFRGSPTISICDQTRYFNTNQVVLVPKLSRAELNRTKLNRNIKLRSVRMYLDFVSVKQNLQSINVDVVVWISVLHM